MAAEPDQVSMAIATAAAVVRIIGGQAFITEATVAAAAVEAATIT